MPSRGELLAAVFLPLPAVAAVIALLVRVFQLVLLLASLGTVERVADADAPVARIVEDAAEAVLSIGCDRILPLWKSD